MKLHQEDHCLKDKNKQIFIKLNLSKNYENDSYIKIKTLMKERRTIL